MARADCHYSNAIPTSILATSNACTGYRPPAAAPSNASECYESLAASSCAPSAGDEHASECGGGYEQYDSRYAANSTAPDHVSEYVSATTDGRSAERSAA